MLPSNSLWSPPQIVTENGVTVKDVVPRSIWDGSHLDDDDCICGCECCKCNCCASCTDWFVRDPFGIACGITTWLLFLFGEFVVVFVILPTYSGPMRWGNIILFHFLALFAVMSHLRAMFSDPGTVTLNNATKENLLKYARGTVLHRCPMCVQRMDHHLYTFLISLHAIILIIYHLYTCVSSDWTACKYWSPPATIIFIIFLAFEGLSFGIFTMIMFCSQVWSIYTDVTAIESLKKEYTGKRQSFISALKIVFGTQFGIHWLNPFFPPTHHLIINNEECVLIDV
ncbi:unnamed protein product [Didymodactylos carnosus]|uniref:Palmitoyltransferase n=1 Tax=Didymodactylos carnosus TaxID=1234261 RepID=A0A813VHZ3_9BILA|nr:unnamed protein product [Didymodactylos carnosus]CAF3625958.1 unnamed protein product [Didymodactylos carnosus]